MIDCNYPFGSYNLEHGPGSLGGGTDMLTFIKQGLLAFSMDGISDSGSVLFFPVLIASHLFWSIARPIFSLLIRVPGTAKSVAV